MSGWKDEDGNKIGSTHAWRKVRAMVLARDGYECQIRITGICTGKGTQCHHLFGRGSSLGDDPSGLVACCQPCNLHVGLSGTDPPARPNEWWV